MITTDHVASAGSSTEKWRALLAEPGTILADGAMGTMLFEAGLQFGDPPEVWNITQPDLIRRIHRGYLGRRLQDPADQHLRRQPAAARALRAPEPRRRPEPDRGDPPPGRGGCGRRLGARCRRHRAERLDHGAARDAGGGRRDRRVRRAGRCPRRGRRRHHLDRDDVGPGGDQDGDRRCPPGGARDPDHRHDDVRHPRPHDDGRPAGTCGQVPGGLGRRRHRRQLRQRAGGAHAGHREDARGVPPMSSWSPSRTPECPSSWTAARST